MLNAEDLKIAYYAFLDEFGLNPMDVTVVSGGSLVMRGMRKETRDIDVDVSGCVMDWFHSNPSVEQSTFIRQDGTAVMVLTHKKHPLVDIHRQMRGGTRELVEGVCIQSLEDCLKLKKMLDPAKHQTDIDAIELVLGLTV